MFVWFKIDVFHIYMVKPTPPPSGYRTVFDVPMSDWPILVVIGASVVLGKIDLSWVTKSDNGCGVQTLEHHHSQGTVEIW